LFNQLYVKRCASNNLSKLFFWRGPPIRIQDNLCPSMAGPYTR